MAAVVVAYAGPGVDDGDWPRAFGESGGRIRSRFRAVQIDGRRACLVVDRNLEVLGEGVPGAVGHRDGERNGRFGLVVQRLAVPQAQLPANHLEAVIAHGIGDTLAVVWVDPGEGKIGRVPGGERECENV